MENQTQYFKICKKCSGLNHIISKSDSGFKIKAITIPRDACKSCVDEGYKEYKKTESNYTNIYLQDRLNDEYFQK